jgi:hypothetical protein
MATNEVRVKTRDDYLRPPTPTGEEKNYTSEKYDVPVAPVDSRDFFPNLLPEGTYEERIRQEALERALEESQNAAASAPSEELIPGPIVPGDPRWSYEEMMAGRGTPVNPRGQTFTDMVAQNQFDGSPYDQAADYMMERREAQMRAIQDMYNQYASETQANVDRIGDIYGGASAGVGQTYDSATGNIQDAYSSAQQQAADQMARLGIEEAAPTVINPMALSQAEDLSSLETNRASTLGATEQFGATAGGFATNMAQVAQQGALENQRGATEQLADQLFELEMQRAQAQQAFNPYQRALQEMEAEQAFNQFYNPQPDTEAAQRAAELQLETTLSRQDKVLQLWSDIRQDYDSDEEAFAAAQAAIQQAEALFPIQ